MARTERTALLRGDEDVEIALKTRRGDKDASADDAREALGRRERRARESNGGAEASTSARGMKTARAVVVGTLAAGAIAAGVAAFAASPRAASMTADRAFASLGERGMAMLGSSEGAGRDARPVPVLSKRFPGYAAPFSGRFERIGEWPEHWLVKCSKHVVCEQSHLGAFLGSRDAPAPYANPLGHGLPRGYVRPDQARINEFISTWDSNARQAHGGVYELPQAGKAKMVAMAHNSAYFYNFVHVPKAGGSYFSITVLMEALERSGEHHGYPYKLTHEPVSHWITLPQVDLTQTNVKETYTHFQEGKPEGIFGPENTKQMYEEGKRMFGKGQFGMGLCEVIHAPCVYLTVLRDPVERYLSHYKYSCLAGSEGAAQWLPEWKELDRCPLDPIEFMDYLGPNLDWTIELAPGAKNAQERMETAKRNLDSNCLRYLILEKYEDGLDKLGATYADFLFLNKEPAKERHKKKNEKAKNAGHGVSEGEQDRFDIYMKNQTIVDAIAARHAKMKEVYDYAVAKYEANWARAPGSC